MSPDDLVSGDHSLRRSVKAAFEGVTFAQLAAMGERAARMRRHVGSTAISQLRQHLAARGLVFVEAREAGKESPDDVVGADVSLANRPKGALGRRGLGSLTYAQLATHEEREIASIRGMGVKGILALRAALAVRGLTFAGAPAQLCSDSTARVLETAAGVAESMGSPAIAVAIRSLVIGEGRT